MTLTLAAVGAVLAAVLESALWPHIVVGEAHPHLVFVYVVIFAVVLGAEAGLTAAFVGGLALDLILPRPLGISVFSLLVCAGIASVAGRGLDRIRYVAPIVMVFVLSFVYSIVLATLASALSSAAGPSDPFARLLPGAVYDTLIAAVIGPIAVAFRVRRLEQDRVDW